MEAKRLFYVALFTLFIVGAVFSGVCTSSPDPATIVYVDPPYISTPPGQYFTINISIAEVINLNSWSFKLFYPNKTVLYTNTSMITEGPFLSQDGIYPTDLTKSYDGFSLNVGCHIVGPPSVGVSGSGTLASITFLVQKEGECVIDLQETTLRDPDVALIFHATRIIKANYEGYFNSEKVDVVNNVEVLGKNYTVVTTTNSSISPVPFNMHIAEKEISFNVIGPDDMTGYCNVSIPKSFMNCTALDDWDVTVNGNLPAYFPTPTENATHTFVYFTYTTSTHKVRITSTYMIPELTPPLIGTPIREPSGDVEPGQEVKISVNITDIGTGVKNATLYYTIDNGTSWGPRPMTYNSKTGYYETAIPGQTGGTWVKYKITAYDNGGNHYTEDNGGEYYVYIVVPEFPAIVIFPLFIIATLAAAALMKRFRQSVRNVSPY